MLKKFKEPKKRSIAICERENWQTIFNPFKIKNKTPD